MSESNNQCLKCGVQAELLGCSFNCEKTFCKDCIKYHPINGHIKPFCPDCHFKIVDNFICHVCNQKKIKDSNLVIDKLYTRYVYGNKRNVKCSKCQNYVCSDCFITCRLDDNQYLKDKFKCHNIASCTKNYCKNCYNLETTKLRLSCKKCNAHKCCHYQSWRCDNYPRCKKTVCRFCRKRCKCNSQLCDSCYNRHTQNKCYNCQGHICPKTEYPARFSKYIFCSGCYRQNIVKKNDRLNYCCIIEGNGVRCPRNAGNSNLLYINFPYITKFYYQGKQHGVTVSFLKKPFCKHHHPETYREYCTRKILFCQLSQFRYSKNLCHKCKFCKKYEYEDYIKQENNINWCFKCYLAKNKIKRWFIKIRYDPQYLYCQRKLNKSYASLIITNNNLKIKN